MSAVVEVPEYQYGVKIEQSSKGARVTVHVYHTDIEQAKNEAIRLYQETREQLETAGSVLAPIEQK